MRSVRPAAAMYRVAMGATGGRSKLMHWRFGCCFAASMERRPVAPPMSQSVLYFEKSNFWARVSKLIRESPAIAPMNCSSRWISA